MLFESRLARRYIFAQKRHSILTICSIACALILITVMFVGVFTVRQNILDVSYDSYPYHVLIANVTQEQADIIAKQPEIKSCTIRDAVEFKEDGKTEALVFFTYDVKIIPRALKNAMSAANLDVDEHETTENYTAITWEGIGEDAKMELLISSALYFIVMLLIIFSLRLIIDTAFEVSSRERERQFGVLQSIGATPRQIVGIITHEGLVLSAIGVPLGIGLGVGVAYLVYRLILATGIAVNILGAEKASRLVSFHVQPVTILITVVVGLIWVFFSAYGTGMRIVKMSPMEAIHGKNTRIKKSGKHRLAGLLFGWIGKLSAKNIRRQPKRFFITVLSLTVSMTLFSSFGFVIDSVENIAQSVIYDMTGSLLDYDLRFKVPVEKKGLLSYQEPMKKLENSGYFKNISPANLTAFTLDYLASESDNLGCNIIYLPKEAYEAEFDGNPPVSYEDLAQKNQYILRKGYDYHESFDGEREFIVKSPQNTDIVRGSMRDMIEISKEEYMKHAELSENGDVEHVEKGFFRMLGPDSDSFDEFTRYFKALESDEKYPYSFSIASVFDPLGEYGEDIVAARIYSYSTPLLIGTLEQFEKQEYQKYEHNFYMYWFGREDYTYFNVSLRNPDQHDAAIRFLKKEMGMRDGFEDLFAENQKMRSMLSAVRIGLGAVIILLALVAILNMVNIISTSLLNRKSEFAALQSIGMSPKQLLKLTFLEAFQYVLIAGVFAVVLCLIVVYLTNKFMTDGLMLNATLSYSIFLPRLGIGAVVALFVAFIATFIPMQRMRSESIVDNIRSID